MGTPFGPVKVQSAQKAPRSSRSTSSSCRSSSGSRPGNALRFWPNEDPDNQTSAAALLVAFSVCFSSRANSRLKLTRSAGGPSQVDARSPEAISKDWCSYPRPRNKTAAGATSIRWPILRLPSCHSCSGTRPGPGQLRGPHGKRFGLHGQYGQEGPWGLPRHA